MRLNRYRHHERSIPAWHRLSGDRIDSLQCHKICARFVCYDLIIARLFIPDLLHVLAAATMWVGWDYILTFDREVRIHFFMRDIEG
jgi:hypothetical protein